MVQHGRDDPAVVEWRQKSGLMKNKIKKQKTTHRSLQGTLKKHYFLCGCSGTIWTDSVSKTFKCQQLKPQGV